MNQLDDQILDVTGFSYQELIGRKTEWTPKQNPRNVTASGNVNALDDEVRVDCTAGAVTMTLETAVGCDGRQHTFKKIDASANAMIVDGLGSETIDGGANLTTTVQYTAYVIKSNGTNWDMISSSVVSTPGTVTSIAETFTGGLISVAGSPITTSGTLALTVAGTSGGVPYFSSGTTWASSAALAASAIVLGGGAGTAPATTATGTGVVTALGVAVGSAGAFVTFNGALGTPSSGNAANLTGYNAITLGTEQASTSGTSIDFTGIPAGVKRITIMFNGVSTNGSSNMLIQIGDAGGIETTGYVGAGSFIGATVSSVNSTAGFISVDGDSATLRYGSITLSLEDASDFTWVASGVIGRADIAATAVLGGAKSLSAVLDRVRITTVNGTDAFDAGVINISYAS